MEDVVTDTAAPESPLAKWRNEVSRKFHHYLERSSPHTARRWLVTLAAAAIYILRVYYARGFYVISYGLSIYILNLLIGFLSPKVDPELELLDGPSSPTKDPEEFRPFVRRLPEFLFWFDTYAFSMLSLSCCELLICYFGICLVTYRLVIKCKL